MPTAVEFIFKNPTADLQNTFSSIADAVAGKMASEGTPGSAGLDELVSFQTGDALQFEALSEFAGIEAPEKAFGLCSEEHLAKFGENVSFVDVNQHLQDPEFNFSRGLATFCDGSVRNVLEQMGQSQIVPTSTDQVGILIGLLRVAEDVNLNQQTLSAQKFNSPL